MKLSAEDITEIKKVYTETGSYAETARRLHRSPATVKKYATGEATPAKKKKRDPDIIDFESLANKDNLIEPLPIEKIVLPEENFRSWTVLTTAERNAMNLGTVRKK